MLLDNEKHKRFHQLGPKDCYFGGKRKAVASISVTRSTIHDEQFSIAIPIFSDDTRQTLEDRVGMFLSIAQDRRDDATQAWLDAEENQEKVAMQNKVIQGQATEAEKKAYVASQGKGS